MRTKCLQISFVRLLIPIIMLLITGACLMGCNNSKEQETIETVLHAMLTYPDKNYDKIIDSMEAKEDLNQSIEEIYGDFFTEGALETFKNARYPLSFLTHAAENEYEMKLDHVEIKQDKGDAHTWNFSVTIEKKDELGAEKNVTENGAVRFTDDLKMEYFIISSNNM